MDEAPDRPAEGPSASAEERLVELQRRLAAAEAEVAALRSQRDSSAEETERLRATAGLVAELTLVVPLTDDPRPWLQRIARLLVPKLADGCLFELLEGAQTLPVAAAHCDEATAAGLLAGDATAVEKAFRGAALRAPLTVRAERLGWLTVWTERERSLGPAEHALVDWVARHAAAQLDNARLYSRVQTDARMRDEFVAMAAHELRTPLQALGMGLDLIKGRLDGTADELPRPWLEARLSRTRQQVSRLKQLVDSLLNVSEIQSGSLELRPERFDLADAVRDLAARAEDELRWAGCTLTTALDPAEGSWDRLRVELIASNLIGNAIKYGTGKPIHVAVEAGSARVRLSVRDGGVGIAPEHLERIFGRFERLHGSSRTSGFGLGLWIVRELVRAMGGTIRVESTVGAGSTFTVELPIGS